MTDVAAANRVLQIIERLKEMDIRLVNIEAELKKLNELFEEEG